MRIPLVVGSIFLLADVFVGLSQASALNDDAPHDLRALVERHAEANGVPVALAHAVVTVESGYDPSAREGPNIGMMQVQYPTARLLGYAGSEEELFDPTVNVTYGMRYLAGAYRLAGGETCGTVQKYSGGHGDKHLDIGQVFYCVKVKAVMASGRDGLARTIAGIRQARAAVAAKGMDARGAPTLQLPVKVPRGERPSEPKPLTRLAGRP